MKISVAIPAYNAQKTIGEAVAQSLAQAKGSLEVEVVVVDDGSIDNTSDVAASAGAGNLLRGVLFASRMQTVFRLLTG